MYVKFGFKHVGSLAFTISSLTLHICSILCRWYQNINRTSKCRSCCATTHLLWLASHGQPTYKNKIAPIDGLDLFIKTTFGDSPKQYCKPNDHVDLQSYVNNPNLVTPILSSSLSIAHASFRRTPFLYFRLQPPRVVFTQPCQTNPEFEWHIFPR